MKPLAAAALSITLLAVAGRAGQITGIVVSAQGGEPLASVELTLSPVQQDRAAEQRRGRRPRPTPGPNARTALDGRFVFHDVAPGDYVIGASKAGFEGAGRVARRATVDESGESAGVRIELNRSPSIEGRIVDADGDPLAGARIELRGWSMSYGRRVLRGTRGAEANDLGEYRIYNLVPGRYLLYLNPMTLGMIQGGVLYETSGAYYPQGLTPAEAAKIELDWGQDLKGLDFVAQPASGTLVSGAILDENGLPCESCSLSILDAAGLPAAATRVSRAGRFAVQGLPAGEYSFAGRAPRGSGLAVEKVYLSEDRPVELALRLVPGQPVSGRIVADKDDDGEPLSLDRTTVRLLPADRTLAGQPMGTRVSATGELVFEDVAQGLYSLTVFGIPSGGYLRRVRRGGTELPDGVLRITGDGPIAGLELDVAFDGGSVQGRAVADDPEDPAPPDGLVVLVPLSGAKPANRQHLVGYRGADVGFQLRSVAPGEYLVFSTPRNFTWDWSDPTLMAELRRRANRVEVKAGETVAADAPYLQGP